MGNRFISISLCFSKKCEICSLLFWGDSIPCPLRYQNPFVSWRFWSIWTQKNIQIIGLNFFPPCSHIALATILTTSVCRDSYWKIFILASTFGSRRYADHKVDHKIRSTKDFCFSISQLYSPDLCILLGEVILTSSFSIAHEMLIQVSSVVPYIKIPK